MENELSQGRSFLEDAQPTAAQRLKQTRGRESLQKYSRPVDGFIRYVMMSCGLVSIFTTVAIVLVLGNEALRFFTTIEFVNTNKQLAEMVTAEQTTLPLAAGGQAIQTGYIIRIGEETMRVTEVVDSQMIVVERGVDETLAVEHSAQGTLSVGHDVSLGEFLTTTIWQPQAGEFGILPLLTATLMSTVIGMLVAIPLGLGSAIYLSEYAPARVRAWLKPTLEILAGIPTVVFGFFALNFMTPVLRGFLGQGSVQLYNVAAAGIVLGIAIIPIISSMSEDALSAVPRSLREASYGMGATKLETAFKVLIPAALSGLVAAFIVGMSRAVGETMIMAIAAGAGPRLSLNPFQSAETIAGHMVRISTGDISYNSVDYNSLFALGLTLFLFTLTLNTIAGAVSRRFREAYQ